MNAVRKMVSLLEGAYTAFQKAKIYRNIEFWTLAFGFAFLLACFFIQNNVMHFKQIPPSKSFDQSSVFPIMLVYLSIVYPLYFVWLKNKKFTYERSLTIKLYGSNNKPLLRSFCRYSREQGRFLPKESLVAEGKTDNPDQWEHSEKMMVPGTLVAGLAHEINNPMTFVNTSVYNLKQDLEKLKIFLVELAGDEKDNEILAAFDERFRTLFNHLDTINEGTNRIQEIVRNLKSFSQINHSGLKQVDVQEGLETTINLVKSNYKNHVELITDFEPGFKIQGNEGEIKQVFMNIIINACHAIVEKQKRTGEKTKGSLAIKTWKENDQAVISFQDTGTGISEKVRKKMFEPFFTTKPKGEGTGLGLAISSQIIQNHGGRIEAASEPGKETMINLYLPLVREEISSVRNKEATLH